MKDGGCRVGSIYSLSTEGGVVVSEQQVRDQWGTRLGFVLAAIGSAVGLGNIWRFSYMAYSNGGGAFLIPYLFALFTAGIPLMILEFALGHKLRGSAPLAFARLGRRWEWLGWWPVVLSFILVVYYMVIIAWSFNYLIFSFTQPWGQEPAGFFINDFLRLTGSPWDFGSFRWPIVATIIGIWVLNFVIIYSGIEKGIERANKIFMPLLAVLVIIITVRGLTLPGALSGLNYYLQPDFSALLDARVWVAAYGQIFFTLSLGFGAMIIYSSYLPEKSDLVNNAFITSLTNCSFSFLVGMGVFGILGYMAEAQQMPFEQVVDKSIMLAFAVFPKAINTLPTFNVFFGILFFGSLVLAGISSSVSLVETVAGALMDKFNLSRPAAVTGTSLVAMILSLGFAFGNSLMVLDIVDHFINNYGIAVTGLLECIVLGWFFRLDEFKEYVNRISDFSVGSWWIWSIKIITPFVLGIMSIQNLLGDLSHAYGDYPVSALLVLGVLVVLVSIAAALALTTRPWRENWLLKPTGSEE